MAMSPELRDFCGNWRQKATDYGHDVRGAFDRFFTLYVVFNRLYAEATFRLARKGQAKLQKRFPDSQASQEYVVQFVTARRLTDAWTGSPEVSTAIAEIADHLRQHQFFLKLDLVTGEQRPNEDADLLVRLESKGRNKRAQAGLEVLYVIRCNMFHGHKGFRPVQLDLLRPALVLLEATIEVLQHALEENGG